jgi:hypothetical protein
MDSHLNDVYQAHSEAAAAATVPALGSFGAMSNFLGAASATTTEPDINKMVESAFEKHHLTEKIANLKEIQSSAQGSKENLDKMVTDSFEKHHLSEKIADLKSK